MMIKIEQSYIGPEKRNELYAQGYRYIVDGDYQTLNTTDPWSGMPDTTNNVYAFTDKTEAEKFAVTQIWVFNKDIHAKVKELPKHTETWQEFSERYAKEKAEAKAKKEAKEAQKAANAGMTLEEYRKAKAHEKAKRKLEKEIAELEADLAKKKAELAKI